MATLEIKEGASVLGAELSVAISSLESDVYVSFIIPIAKLRDFHQSLEQELDEEGHDGAFYDVIIKNKSNFLQYCHVVVQTHNLKGKIWRKDASEMRKQLEIVKPAIALRNQPAGSFFLSAMDQDGACNIHWIQQDKTINMVKIITHTWAPKERSQPKITKDPRRMAFLLNIFPIFW